MQRQRHPFCHLCGIYFHAFEGFEFGDVEEVDRGPGETLEEIAVRQGSEVAESRCRNMKSDLLQHLTSCGFFAGFVAIDHATRKAELAQARFMTASSDEQPTFGIQQQNTGGRDGGDEVTKATVRAHKLALAACREAGAATV